MRIVRTPRYLLTGLFFLFFGLGGDISRGGVVINEIQSSNSSTIWDEDGEAGDWIELLNTGGTAENMGGWGLSDRADNPWKWTLPAVSLAPGERLLVWATGKNRTELPSVSFTSPGDVPGLVLWLNAGEITQADGSSVTQWDDRSGSANHAAAPAATAPTFRTNQASGKPAVHFRKADKQWLQLPVANFSDMSSLNNFTVFFVSRWGGTAISGLMGAWGGAGNSGNAHFEITETGSLRLRVGALDFRSANGAVSGGEWTLFAGEVSGVGDAPSAALFKNGVELASQLRGTGATQLANYGTFAIGASHIDAPDNERQFDGEIAEVLLFNRALTLEERNYVEKYLSNTYALPAPPDRAPQLHASFSISAGGEDIVLTRPDGATADLVPAVEIPNNASYGRRPDGTGGFVFFAEPTPAAANTTAAYGAPLGFPGLSRPRGIQEVPFQLAISHPDPQATIVYTLDGSEPTPGHGTVHNGTAITVNKTTIVRAAAFKDGALPTRRITTASYLFLDDIIQVTGRPAGYPASWGSFGRTSYGISPYVAGQSGYAGQMKAALRSLPTLSISMPVENLFGAGGIYANPEAEGYELPASVEWIAADGTSDVQADAALRVQGGASREFAKTPKKSLRLLFKSAYGPGALQFPILQGSGTAMNDFNTLVLRSDFNNSWVHHESAQRPRGGLVRDKWVRDTQIAMSGLGAHGNHAHLYLNGIYWGVYNPSERPDAAFAASYLGGEREDYDAMTHDGLRDGNDTAWQQLRQLAQGGLSSVSAYEQVSQLLNIDHFIDYMILNIYGGNLDWPHNNWNAVRKRESGAGWLFFAWDGERTLESVNENRVSLTGSNNPAEFYAALRQNPEFRLRFADRVNLHFHNGGALSPAVAASRFQARAEAIEQAMFGEQARWGAYRNEVYDLNGPSPRYTVASHFVAEKNRLLDTYFPARTGVVLAQFRAANLYPSVDAPVFSQHGGVWTPGEAVTLSASGGTIYYTTDGTDPRLAGGAVAASANEYTGAVPLSVSTRLQARVLRNGVWSALTSAAFFVDAPETVFLPAGTAAWTQHNNWSGGVYPDSPGARARIDSPAANRNVDVNAPVTVGQIRFVQNAGTARNRVRAQVAANHLTFDGGPNPARVIVEGNGTGFVEFELLSNVVLATDLVLETNQIDGDVEFGALRLRQTWNGTGGIVKTGPGMAALTGEDKNFRGALRIQQGVLSVTEPSTPFNAASVTVESGGQLRLTSGGTPRIYNYPVPVVISGAGRGSEVPDGDKQGKLGALRYEPGSDGNHAVLNAPVALAGGADIHVDRWTNVFELAHGLAGGAHALTKTGGGTLLVGGNSTAFTGPIQVENGTLQMAANLNSAVTLANIAYLSGHGTVGNILGNGTVLLDGTVLRAANLSGPGTTLAAVFRQPGSPNFSTAVNAGNGLLVLAAASAAPATVRIYLAADGTVFRGGLFVPDSVNFGTYFANTTFEVYRPNAAGLHQFQGQGWSPVGNARVSLARQFAGLSSGGVAGQILEVFLGAAPASFADWRLLMFPDAADLDDAQISGPLADPTNSGVSNLMRYALGLDAGEPAAAALPQLVKNGSALAFSFPFDPAKTDIAYIVEVSEDLQNWEQESVLFDSRNDTGVVTDGRLSVSDPVTTAPRRFYRLKIVQLP